MNVQIQYALPVQGESFLMEQIVLILVLQGHMKRWEYAKV